ncbi:amidophosphoribosyltransferase [Brumimicrobium aurantiacum]|uniref:Amidophosphoribosyltransferase n=1 Tax=Brumimicrobium aurantiacum TaxID=1737063 RepID=A0A3E1EXQ9_9FLAO|nr:amidophosphoribosyltransferase [Brumimicrobium aurantiacum]RFC54346.1 amidophosphoribosyltransferase [Brumimicrobium aurantiacum]
MSDAIKHECGIALLRLKKPLEFYIDKYGSAFYGLNKMYLLMEKQHNRGQDGAGLANIKLDMSPGERYISRRRSVDQKPIQDIFTTINQRFEDIAEHSPEKLKDIDFLKKNVGFTGELFLGHLRYGTSGKNGIESCHPFLRQNNWMTRNLVVAGNFNLTNVDELFDVLLNLGQHPKEKSDTVTVLEKIGHFLDEENEDLFQQYKSQGYNNKEITSKIAEHLDIVKILKRASEDWDGGYTMSGLFGHGDAFVLRDPAGIRPAFWYEDDEIFVVTSERPVIQTAFNLKKEDIKELNPGHALILKKSGEVSEEKINEPTANAACSFERIYFSRGNDFDIYNERKLLGQYLVPQIIDSINNELDNAVFSFIPNTAEMSFYGMMKGLEDYLNVEKIDAIKALGNELTDEKLQQILTRKTRFEKIAIKDAKLRTFITQDDARDDMVAHVYDITYGTVKRNEDNLVVIDDSIVRGTTLKQSILRILDRLEPKKIVVVSSAPQIRYPDCYGIDMAKMGDFIAFEAAIELLKENGKGYLIDDIYKKCVEQQNLPKEQIKNYVKEIYAPFTPQEISDKIAQLLTPVDMKSEVKIVYQTIENLHKACPNNTGDWYFTGNYPTPGGNKVVNKAYMNYIEGISERAY